MPSNQNMKIEHTETNVLTNNTNTEKLYIKLDFEAYGVQKNYLKINNRYLDQKRMILFKTTHF